MPEPTLLIQGGSIVDGAGAAPFEADVVLAGERIAHIGRGLSVPRGTPVLDARGQLVTPGFVDIHTHDDAQATWTSRILSSLLHGVTTALLGNCGVGLPPAGPKAATCWWR